MRAAGLESVTADQRDAENKIALPFRCLRSLLYAMLLRTGAKLSE